MCSVAAEDLEEVSASGPTSCGGSSCQANGCQAGGESSTVKGLACEASGCSPTENGDGAAAPARAAQVLCQKCKQRRADVLTQQSHRVCRACLYATQHARVAQAIRVERLIAEGDRVLLALSGGASSRALLHILASLRNPDSARRARGLTSFQLSAMYVDESAAVDASPATGAAAAAAVAESCEAAGGYSDVELHVARLEDVNASDEERRNAAALRADPSAADARRAKLRTLLEAVTDATGREDLTDALRKQLLLLRAGDLGCNRLVMGDSATRVAVRVVSGTTKGQGYALPGDIQSADAREGSAAAVVVYPAKGLMARDLALVCHYERLPLVAQPALGAASRASINVLAAAFVEGLQSNVPSAVSTIHRTAARLQAFRWNSTLTGAADDATSEEDGQLCPVCRAPMTAAEVGVLRTAGGHAKGSAPDIPCCRSCSYQLATALQPSAAVGSSDDDSTAAEGGRPSQPCLPAFMRMRIQALRTGMLLDPHSSDADMLPGK